MNPEYSSAEIRLIRHFEYLKIAQSLSPPELYRIMAMDAFIKNKQGPFVNALRKCVAAMQNCTVCRSTDEWDRLITNEIGVDGQS